MLKHIRGLATVRSQLSPSTCESFLGLWACEWETVTVNLIDVWRPSLLWAVPFLRQGVLNYLRGEKSRWTQASKGGISVPFSPLSTVHAMRPSTSSFCHCGSLYNELPPELWAERNLFFPKLLFCEHQKGNRDPVVLEIGRAEGGGTFLRQSHLGTSAWPLSSLMFNTGASLI